MKILKNKDAFPLGIRYCNDATSFITTYAWPITDCCMINLELSARSLKKADRTLTFVIQILIYLIDELLFLKVYVWNIIFYEIW